MEPVVAWAIADELKTKIRVTRSNVSTTKDANGFREGKLLISILLLWVSLIVQFETIKL
jgi:hypothetical protein